MAFVRSNLDLGKTALAQFQQTIIQFVHLVKICLESPKNLFPCAQRTFAKPVVPKSAVSNMPARSGLESMMLLSYRPFPVLTRVASGLASVAATALLLSGAANVHGQTQPAPQSNHTQQRYNKPDGDSRSKPNQKSKSSLLGELFDF